MFGTMINTDMLMFVIKGELEKIYNGVPPEGFIVKEHLDSSILLEPTKKFTGPDIKEISGKITVVYKDKTINILL